MSERNCPLGRTYHAPFNARIFWCGCMMALSAVIGRRRTLLASARSTITTWFCSPTFSRMQMKWSDSSVNVYASRIRHELGGVWFVIRTWNEIEAGCTPMADSCKCSQNEMGLEISMVGGDFEDTSRRLNAALYAVEAVARREGLGVFTRDP